MAQFAAIAAGGASLGQFALQRTAAEGIRGEAEISAQAEEVAATTREADRKSRLATALASQIASSGAKGIAAFEGSPLTILEEDIRREEVATQRDKFQTRFSTLTKRAKGRIQERQIKTGAALSLIGDAGKIASTV